jgi:EAL domain-containing protein (putative c-di-GMP-specific phosphodiesterase class I)
VAFEALLRARSPHGEVLPSTLFGAAERAGWLHVLDRVGRTTALREAAGWLGDRMLFVNFLPTTIYRPEVCLATTERAAARAGLRLDQLVFEVTESERVSDLGHLKDVFAYYRDRGCGVALDDLGAGYSSLNMLVQLQPDVVKLDKEIVQMLPAAASRSVVSAVVDITHAYGGKVLAECVETAEQASAARDLGVDLGQGWFFGRPERRQSEPAPPVEAPSPVGVSSDRFAGDDPAVAIAGSSPAGEEVALIPRGC